MRNNDEKHKHAHMRAQVFMVEILSGENHPTTAAFLNYFISMMKKLYIDYLTPIRQKTWLPLLYFGIYQFSNIFLLWIYKLPSTRSSQDQ